jgi:sulfonate transport system substrate-binding protein
LLYWNIGGVPEHFNLPWTDLIRARGVTGGGADAARRHGASSPGLQLAWREYPGGTGAMVEALGNGELDLAVLLTEGAVAGIGRGAEYEIVAKYVDSPLIWGIHVPPASGFQDIADLANARFAVSRKGSGSHLMVLALGNERGWQVRDEQFVVVGSLAGAIEAFAAGAADVFLWERFMTQPVVDGGDFRRIGDFTAPWSAFVTCANPTALERQTELEQLIDAVGAEAQRFAQDPGTPDRVAARFRLAPAQVRAWLARTRWADGLTRADSDIAAARAMLVQAGVLSAR